METLPAVSGPKKLRDIVRDGQLAEQGLLVEVVGDDCYVDNATHDSRQVAKGSLFCCVVGETHDGHNFAHQAIEAGASALLVQKKLTVSVPQVVVTDVRRSMGVVASALYGFPSERLLVIGVTGTNGKTTTSHLLANVLREHGLVTRVLGTLSAERTTLEATDLQRTLAACEAEGVQAVVMEVTSHAMSLHRVVGTRFAAAVFTNLSQDHLDFHHTMDQYFAAKAMLFSAAFAASAIVNADDVYGRKLIESVTIPVQSFSESSISEVVVTPSSHAFAMDGETFIIPLGGRFNIHNSLAVIATASTLGVAMPTIARGLASADVVPGRFQSIHVGQNFEVIVDYAHTPDALERLLVSVRESIRIHSKIIVVFGCGGDRDIAKRPAMGEVAANLADVVVITSDNPRSESAELIASQINDGVKVSDSHKVLAIELDRRVAITRACSIAKQGDVVVIAGKGHERTQTIGTEVLPFSDVEVAREILGAYS